MKFDFVINTIDKLLCISDKDKNADMRLPAKVPYFGAAMAFVGLLIAIMSIVTTLFFLLFFCLYDFFI